MRYKQKGARKSSRRAHLRIFTPHFSKFRAFRMLHPPKRHVCLKFSVEKKTFYFSKRVLRRGTARSVLVKISPVVCLFECERLYFKL